MSQPNFEFGVPVAVNPDDQDHTEDDQFAVEGNDLSGYVGVSPEYQTYADKTHAPLTGDEEADEEADDDYNTWTVDELQKEADERDLEVTGTGANGNVVKDDLVRALEADDAENPEA